MKKSPRLRFVSALGHASVGLTTLLLSSIFSHPALAQSSAVVDPEREYTFGDNQAVCDLGSSVDSSFGGRFDFYAGAQQTTVVSGGVGFLPSTFPAYCVDIASDINRPAEPVTVGTLDQTFSFGVAANNSGINVGGAIAYLYNANAGNITGQTETAAQNSAALQLAIWTVEYNWDGTGLGDIDPTLTTGNFHYEGSPEFDSSGTIITDINGNIVYDPVITAAIRSDASSMLTAWSGQTTTGVLLLGSRFKNQSLVGTSAPEPGALALVSMPMAGLVAGQMRRRRKS